MNNFSPLSSPSSFSLQQITPPKDHNVGSISHNINREARIKAMEGMTLDSQGEAAYFVVDAQKLNTAWEDIGGKINFINSQKTEMRWRSSLQAIVGVALLALRYSSLPEAICRKISMTAFLVMGAYNFVKRRSENSEQLFQKFNQSLPKVKYKLMPSDKEWLVTRVGSDLKNPSEHIGTRLDTFLQRYDESFTTLQVADAEVAIPKLSEAAININEHLVCLKSMFINTRRVSAWSLIGVAAELILERTPLAHKISQAWLRLFVNASICGMVVYSVINALKCRHLVDHKEKPQWTEKTFKWFSEGCLEVFQDSSSISGQQQFSRTSITSERSESSPLLYGNDNLSLVSRSIIQQGLGLNQSNTNNRNNNVSSHGEFKDECSFENERKQVRDVYDESSDYGLSHRAMGSANANNNNNNNNSLFVVADEDEDEDDDQPLSVHHASTIIPISRGTPQQQQQQRISSQTARKRKVLINDDDEEE